MVQSELSKKIKAINTRYIDFINQGLTDTTEFQKLQDQIIALPHHEIKKGKHKGLLQLNNYTTNYVWDEKANDVVLKSKFTQFQINKIEKLHKKPFTTGTSKINARQWLMENGNENPTNEEVITQANRNGEIHRYILTYKDAIYGHEKLGNAVHRPWTEKLTQGEVNMLYSDIVNNAENRTTLANKWREEQAKNFNKNKGV